MSELELVDTGTLRLVGPTDSASYIDVTTIEQVKVDRSFGSYGSWGEGPPDPPAPESWDIIFTTVLGADTDEQRYMSRLGISYPSYRLAEQDADRIRMFQHGATTIGADAIAAERVRQIVEERWSTAHDDAWADSELIRAASCYIAAALVIDGGGIVGEPPPSWPWHRDWWKPSTDPERNLVKAGALIAADLDRRHRSQLL